MHGNESSAYKARIEAARKAGAGALANQVARELETLAASYIEAGDAARADGVRKAAAILINAARKTMV